MIWSQGRPRETVLDTAVNGMSGFTPDREKESTPEADSPPDATASVLESSTSPRMSVFSRRRTKCEKAVGFFFFLFYEILFQFLEKVSPLLRMQHTF